LYLLLVIFFASQNSRFLTADNARVIATQGAVLGIVTLGQMIVLLAGGFDLSISGVVPLSAVCFVLFSNGGLPGSLAGALAVLIGAAVGVGNGAIVTKLKVNPLIATLGTLSICQGTAYVVTDGRTKPLDSTAAAGIARPTALDVPVFVIVFLAIAAVMFIVLRWSIPGRAIYAVGGGREAARLAGMRVDFTQGSAFVVSGALSGLAGVVLASQLLAGAPSVGSEMTLTSISAAVLGGVALQGGVGGVPGTLLGILIIGTLRNGLALLEISAFYQLIATGAVLLLAVIMGRIRIPFRRTRSTNTT
jgi:ribose transport system permease protein